LSPDGPADAIQVVCAVEGEAYVRHCAAMLHSLLLHNPGVEIRIDYLHGDDTGARNRRRVAAMVSDLGSEIRFHEVPDRWVQGLPIKGFTRKATWYRILLDELLPDIDRVLYLDADLLVTDSVVPLWQTGLAGQLVAAVSNVPMLHDRLYTERPELGGDPYFNAGVLVMDLAGIRREGVGPELRELGVRHAARLRWRDQDVLNEVLHHRRLPLPPRWNCMNSVMNFPWAYEYFSVEDLEDARRNPAIRHFEGPADNKPWHLLAQRALRRKYVAHRRNTPWPRVWRTGCTPANIVRFVRRRRFMRQASLATIRPMVKRLFLTELVVRTNNFGSTRWLGVPIWQNVLDLWMIQETIADLKPALLIEVGTNRGGAALFYASLMDLLGVGRVITIDILRMHQLNHPRIDFLLGDSIDSTTVRRVVAAADAADGPVMVILDGDHSEEHVRRELELYAPLVTPGSWLLSQDGVIDELGTFADSRPGPLAANRAFLAQHPEFEYDRDRNEQFLATHHPCGWLRRAE
jgi:cephalosporin hydroxylase/lipopolysaccharide biosynthesis glycosyltransferase